MKLFFLPLLLLAMSAFSQSSFSPKNIENNQLGEERWDLNKYLWSQTHSPTGNSVKPIIDFTVMDNWISLGDPKNSLSISQDGRFFAYTIDRGDRWNYRNLDSLVVQSTINSWRRSFAKAKPGFFSADNKQYIFEHGKNVYFISLGGDRIDSVVNVSSYKTPPNNEWIAMAINDLDVTVCLRNLKTKTEKRISEATTFSFDKSERWFYYELSPQSRSSSIQLGLYDLNTGKERFFLYVDSYLFDEKGQALVIKETDSLIINNQKETRLDYINLQDSSIHSIWSSTDTTIKIINYRLDGSGKQVVMTLSKNGQNSIWYWKEGMGRAISKLNDQTAGIEDCHWIQGAVSFTDNGKYIRFSLQPKVESLTQKPDAVQIDVWSYRDTILQSAQPELLKRPTAYNMIFNLENGAVVHLETETEKLQMLKGDFGVIKKAGRDIYGDRFWESDYDKNIYSVVSLKDGTRHLLPVKAGNYTIWFSPGGRYVVYFDIEKGCHYFSYDVLTNKIVDISANVYGDQLRYVSPFLHTDLKSLRPAGIAGWLDDDRGLLVYDNNDIWQLDLKGEKPALNLTHSFGFRNKIVFTVEKGERLLPEGPILDSNEPILLEGFNQQNKYNGFYSKKLGIAGDPEELFLGSFLFHGSGGRSLEHHMKPLKAAKANTWIVQRQTATDAPNYFLTTNFKKYKRLTNLQPQKEYNWLTAELISFRQLDGTLSQGVLYKPENFDSTKRYPVIISFYAQLSDLLYQYPTPSYIDAPHIFANPAWMVSHGYFVVIPDIYFAEGQWGPSTVNTVDGAAKYLKTLPYVDSIHIGAAGHSNSGRFGYYLLTHSHSFAAMSLGSGFGGTDIASVSLSEDGALEWAEIGSLGSGLGNLWDNKKSWLDHIAVLNADKVTSPLLLFHNKNDADDIRLAKELFISLWRLEKEAWWLQYDQGGHVLPELRDLRDFTIRYTQFFDHYLKGAPAPRWMMQGLPYKLKGVESRYELYSNGSQRN